AVREQRQHRPENVLIALLIEVFGLEEVRHTDDARRILQHRSEDGLLGLHAVGWQAEIALRGARRLAKRLEIWIQALNSHPPRASGSGAADRADFDGYCRGHGSVESRGHLVRADLPNRLGDLQVTAVDLRAELFLDGTGDVRSGERAIQ